MVTSGQGCGESAYLAKRDSKAGEPIAGWVLAGAAAAGVAASVVSAGAPLEVEVEVVVPAGNTGVAGTVAAGTGAAGMPGTSLQEEEEVRPSAAAGIDDAATSAEEAGLLQKTSKVPYILP